MKFFHLSDLHIGLKLFQRDLYEDQEYVLREVIDYVRKENPDAFLIAGDIYDKAVPSAESVTLFNRFFTELAGAAPSLEIMMISGNHDSASRIDLYRDVLSSRHIHMIGLPPKSKEEPMARVAMQDEYGPVNFYLLPFVRPSMVRSVVGTEGETLSYAEAVRRLIKRENINPEERNVFVSHQFYLPKGRSADQIERMDSEIRTVGNIDEVPADVLSPFDYAALGHIHKPMKVGSDKYRYSGTPIACSVSEAGQKKGIIEVELGAKGDVRTKVLPLHPLREIRVIRGTLSEVLTQPSNDYVSLRITDSEGQSPEDLLGRVREAFPYLLEIRREDIRRPDYEAEETQETEKLSTYELMQLFLGGDLTEEEDSLLQEIVNHAESGEEKGERA
ncbi:MAG: exonuclease SbcCD subunit D [Eubacteriales bacterium]|nr:exonuclease SbcCD subunit D [Eubacteriales bacterium]